MKVTCTLLGITVLAIALAANMPGAIADTTGAVGANPIGTCQCCDTHDCNEIDASCLDNNFWDAHAVFDLTAVGLQYEALWNCDCKLNTVSNPCGDTVGCTNGADIWAGNLCSLQAPGSDTITCRSDEAAND